MRVKQIYGLAAVWFSSGQRSLQAGATIAVNRSINNAFLLILLNMAPWPHLYLSIFGLTICQVIKRIDSPYFIFCLCL
jgi:hypothetical protein